MVVLAPVFVDEHEAFRVHEALPGPPKSAANGDIWPVLLGSPQEHFLCDNPSRRSVDQIVVRQPASMPRATNATWISARVI